MSKIKPVFKSNQPINKEILKQSSCLLTISVGQEVHEGEKFAATIDLVNASFGSAILLIDDSLQRHSMALATQEDADHFYDLSILEGDCWLERNKKYYQNLTILQKIIRWDTWLNHPDYLTQKQAIQARITQDPTYQTSFALTIDAFLTRYTPRLLNQKHFDRQRARKLCLDYLIEECTALCLWVELNCHYEVYPSPRNLAMTDTHKRWVLPFHPDLLHPLAIKFKNRKQLKPQQLYPAVAERLEMLENIIGLMPGHVYWVDQDGVYLGCNDAQAKSAGLPSRKAIVGKQNKDLPWNCNTAVLPETLDNINQEVIKTGKTLSLEEPAVLPDGTELTFLSHKVPLRNQQGSIIGMVGISIDITERKKMEAALRLEKSKAEAANNAKSEFLANMRHDIRTALNGILGISQILSHETDLAKIHYFSKDLVKSSQELLRFLNEILESIEVASGAIRLLNEKFSLKDTLENIVALHQPLATQKHLLLSLDIDAAIPNALIGDPVRVYRIVLELVANALKFTQTGTVKVSAALENVLVSSGKKEGEEQQTAMVKISVEDTGIGIAQDRQSDLFIRFNRLTPSYQGLYKGTGLGLSIVKQFVEDLKGEIYVESEATKGSQFICVLPFVTLISKQQGEKVV